MDRTLTIQFILWLERQGIALREVDGATVHPDRELPGLMDRFIDEWFEPAVIRARDPRRVTQAFINKTTDEL